MPFGSRLLGAQVAHSLTQPLARQGLLDPLPLARLQVKRMLLHIFDDVFLLDLSLEAPESALQRFRISNVNFRQVASITKSQNPVAYGPFPNIVKTNRKSLPSSPSHRSGDIFPGRRSHMTGTRMDREGAEFHPFQPLPFRVDG